MFELILFKSFISIRVTKNKGVLGVNCDIGYRRRDGTTFNLKSHERGETNFPEGGALSSQRGGESIRRASGLNYLYVNRHLTYHMYR